MTALEQLLAAFQNDSAALLRKTNETCEQVRVLQAERNQVELAIARIGKAIAAEKGKP